MGWIIGSLIIVAVIFGITGCVLNKESYDTSVMWKLNKKQLLSFLGLLIMLFGVFTKVPANSVGILYSPFTGTSENTLSEGFHGKSLFDTVYMVSTEVQTITVENLTTQTKDAQYVNSILDIKYRVSENNAYLIFRQYRTLSNMSSTLIVPTTQRILELITTKYNVMDILGESRSDIYILLESALSEEFQKYGIEFYSISITDMDAGEAIEAAITQEAVAKKAVETAEQELLKAQTDAQKLAVQAQAEQDAARIQAETLVIQAQAEKEANELMNLSLSDEILRQQWIEKWDGKTPTYFGGENAGLMFDIGTPKTTTTEQ